VTPEERSKAALKGREGVVVERVFPDSGAAAAGVRAGDILIAVESKSVTDPSDFIAAIAAAQAGEPLVIALVRDGKPTTVKVALKPRPLETSDAYRVIYGAVVSRGKRLRTIVTVPKDNQKHPAVFLIQGLGSFSIENNPAAPGAYGRLVDDYHAATHYAYFRQLASTNLAEAWEKFDGHALAVWGKSDFISSEEDHALIARIVNRAHPGRGLFLALEGIDHGFNRSPSQEGSFKNFGKPDREFNPVFLDALRDWATKVCSAGATSNASSMR
jgi:PDZ domain